MTNSSQVFAQLGPLLEQAQPYLRSYGYLALFFGILLEDFGLPIPGEALLIASAAWAALGHFHILLVVATGVAAAVIGDNIGYAIGHFGGCKVALRYGHYVFLTEKRLHAMEARFNRHGGKIIVVARFLEGLRQFNGLVSGTLRYPWRRFLVFNMIGAVLWVCAWGSLVYYAGQYLPMLYRQFRRWEFILLIALPLLAAALLAACFLLRRR